MNLSRLALRLIACLVLASPPGLSLAHAADPTVAAAPSRERARMNQQVFDRVWSEVRADYYDPELHGVDWDQARRTFRPQALAASDDRALYRVVNQMLDLLDDDHASAASPAVARRQATLRQRRATIGVTLRPAPAAPGVYTVERVRKDSPAHEAGVREGWRLDTTGEGAWHPELDVVEGRTVTLAFAEADGRREVDVTPRVLDPRPAFSADRSRDGVVVLTVEGFEPGLGDWLGRELAATPEEADVVLDLRGNPGGRLLEAEAVLSCFLPRDQVWATRTARSGRGVVMRAAGGCGRLDGPVTHDVAVLIDADSRSAAELTPAALQEAGRAVIVGEATPGAVLISQETRLPDGGKLTLSRADFVTAGGVRLEKRGVRPDVYAKVDGSGVDPALDAAITALATPQSVSVGPRVF